MPHCSVLATPKSYVYIYIYLYIYIHIIVYIYIYIIVYTSYILHIIRAAWRLRAPRELHLAKSYGGCFFLHLAIHPLRHLSCASYFAHSVSVWPFWSMLIPLVWTFKTLDIDQTSKFCLLVWCFAIGTTPTWDFATEDWMRHKGALNLDTWYTTSYSCYSPSSAPKIMVGWLPCLGWI